MVIYCLDCKTKLRLPDEAIGRKVRCRHCGAKFVVDEAFLKDEARFRHVERERVRRREEFEAQFLKPIGKVLGQIRSVIGIILMLPFYAIWAIVNRILNGSSPSLDEVLGRSTESPLGGSSGCEPDYGPDSDSIEECGADVSDGRSHMSASEPDPSRCRRYLDPQGRLLGYRDELGWVHIDCGRTFIGRIADDGSFYDSSGTYRGQIEDAGNVWVDGSGYNGFQDCNTYSHEGHAGIPDIYEEGGDGTGGAFRSLLDSEEDI